VQFFTTGGAAGAAVTIGGLDAPILYTGAAGDGTPGLQQINARVPVGVTPGSAIPVTVTVGGVRSPDGVTMSVK